MKIKKFISVFLAAALILCSVSFTELSGLDFAVKANALEPTGQCGENVYWTFDESSGLLTIDGEGDMYDYEYEKSPFYSKFKYHLESVIIENGITSIGDYAFCYCTSLTEITIPDSVTSIGVVAFFGCKNLTEITIPDGVTSIGGSAFADAGLTEITLPGSVTSIGDYAFECCYSLTGITIPDGVISIGDFAFYGCSNLRNVTFSSNLESIGMAAFLGCNLGDVYLPETVEYIHPLAFVFNCECDIEGFAECYFEIFREDYLRYGYADDEIIMESLIEDLKHNFERYVYLLGLIFEEGLDPAPFIDSSIYITIDEDNPCYCSDSGVIFTKGMSTLVSAPRCPQEYEIPDGVADIGDFAFYFCPGVTSITIPDSVTRIGESVFANCIGLTDITIPDSVTYIDYSAFVYCNSLTDVYFYGTQDQWNENGGIDAAYGATIHFIDDVSENPFKAGKGIQTFENDGKMYVDGFDSGITAEDIEHCTAWGWALEVKEYSADGIIGTGSDITMTDGEHEIDYIVIIRGDVNGDGMVDGMDSIIANSIAQGLLTENQTDTAKFTAADCNRDGEINNKDTAFLEQCGIGLISQK